MIGRSLGKYRVLERIGRGGMGTVYRAIDDTLQREVAIKVLNAEIAEPEALKRFRAEAITLARLQHPAIAMLFELLEDRGEVMMVMEFVRGETLQGLAERMRRVPPDFAAQLCAQALDGLAHAHRAGIVHRDLKPGNIMVTTDGLVKVMDFGIARITGSEHLTSDGLAMGTPAYMAPEQVLGHEVDGRADLYAIGIVLYRLWTGELPFQAETPFAIANKQVNDAPTPLHVACPDLPPWCDAILGRALAKNPADRFQSAQEFKNALASVARFVSLDDLATSTLATPRAFATSSIAPASGRVGGAAWRSDSVPGIATPRPAKDGQSGHTLVISTRHMFAGVGVLIAAIAIIAAGAIVALRRPQTPPSDGAAPTASAQPSTVAATSTTNSQPGPAEATAARGAVPPPAPSPTTPKTAAAAGPDASAASATPNKTAGDAVNATLASVTFDKLKVVVLDGDKAREEDAVLQLAAGRLTILGASKRVVAAVPYDSVRAVTSARSRQPRWRKADGTVGEAKLGGGPLGFMKSDRNWIGLVTPKTVYVIRVDDDRLRGLSQAVADRTGAPVVRLPK